MPKKCWPGKPAGSSGHVLRGVQGDFSVRIDVGAANGQCYRAGDFFRGFFGDPHRAVFHESAPRGHW
jgi:hypothetical protein